MDFEKFKTDGWVHVPSFVSKEKLGKIESKIKIIFDVGSFDELSQKIIELDKSDQSLLYQYNLCVNEITEILSLFLDVDNLMGQLHPDSSGIAVGRYILLGLPGDERLAYSWHQESSYMPTLPTVYTMWIPLFNSAVRENGAMSVLTGTHKLGNVGYSRIDKPQGYCDLFVDTKELIPKYPEHFCCVAPGGGILFDKDLVHRSNFNETENVRFSMVLRISNIKTATQLSISKEDY
jgi:hypothetical protein